VSGASLSLAFREEAPLLSVEEQRIAVSLTSLALASMVMMIV
jgi:hypothetical protein